jgi:hypothetical protein
MLVLAKHSVCAQDSDIREVRLQFPKGTTGTTIEDRLTGAPARG